jgi:hypothetical protein
MDDGRNLALSLCGLGARVGIRKVGILEPRPSSKLLVLRTQPGEGLLLNHHRNLNPSSLVASIANRMGWRRTFPTAHVVD